MAVGFHSWLRGVLGRGTVLDPFAGSGVACTAARLYGHPCTGFDINPYALLLARVSSSVLGPGAWEAVAGILHGMESYRGPGWRPRWSNIGYWYPPEVLEALERLWGYMHSLDAGGGLHVLVVRAALARVSRLYSYADPGVPKLYRGRGPERLRRILAGKPRDRVAELILGSLRRQVYRVLRALQEYTRLASQGPAPRLEEHDTVRDPLPGDLEPPDAVFTSPPYLTAHEYTRSTKLELYWLGYSDREVRAIKAREIPYGPLEPHRVESDTYEQVEETIAQKAPRTLPVYRKYFWALARALDRLAEKNPTIIALFTGPATIAGTPVPIHTILSEHLSAHGYTPVCIETSPIRKRRLFRKRNNTNPNGIQEETLTILKRKT